MRLAATAALLVLLGITALFFGGTLWWVSSLATAAFALLGALALAPAALGRMTLPRDPALATAALAIGAGLVTLPLSINRYWTLEWLCLMTAGAAAYGLAAHVMPSRRAARISALILLTGAILAAAYGTWTTLSGREIVLWIQEADYRDSVTGTFINRNHFASWLGLHLYLGLGLFVAGSSRLRLVLLLPFALGWLALGLTLSRGGLLASAVALPLFFALAGGHTRRRLQLAGVALLLAGSALAATNGHRLRGRIEESFDANGEPSARARLSMWSSTVQAFRDRPVLGFGAGTFRSFYPRYREVGLSRRVTFAHQEWLELLAEQGLVGLLAACAGGVLLAGAWRASLATAGGDRPRVAGAITGTAVVLIHAAVDFPFEIPALLLSAATAGGLAMSLGRSETQTRLSARVSRAGAVLGALVCLLAATRSLQVFAASRHIERGDRAFGVPDWDRALPEYERAVAIDPMNPQAWYALARAEQNKGKFRGRDGKAALVALRDRALGHHLEARRRDPRNADYDLERAWLLNFTGRKAEAAAAFEDAIVNDPANANTLYLAGSFHLHQRDLERGLALIGRAVRCWPKFFGTKIFEIDRAVGDPQRVLAMLPSDQPFLVYQYASFLLDKERIEPARMAFAQAVRDGGARPEWLVAFAGTLAGKVSRAAALELYRDLPADRRTPLTEIEIVKLLLGSGLDKEARAHLAVALERFPASPDLLDGQVLWDRDPDRIEKAAQNYRTARGPLGEDARFHAARGAAALARGAGLDALASFEDALGFQPLHPGAISGLALALERLARDADAQCDDATAQELRRLARDVAAP